MNVANHVTDSRLSTGNTSLPLYEAGLGKGKQKFSNCLLLLWL